MAKVFLTFCLIGILMFPMRSFSQVCDYFDSGQNLGSDPTFGVALGDFDGDGDQDAFTVDAYNDLEIYFNNGSGIFSLSQTITPAAGEGDNFGVHLADVDNDGDLDAIVVPFYNSASLKIYKNNGAGNFTLFQAVSSNLGCHFAGIGDLDGDNDTDVFLPGWMSSETKVFLNNGNGMYTQFSSLTLTNFGGSNDVAMADADGDGDLDAIVVSSNAGGRLLINDGTGTFTDSGQTLGNTSDSYYTVEAGDIEKDGDADVIIGGMYAPLTALTNNGSGVFSPMATYLSSNYDKDMLLLDYDNDNDPDVFVSTYGGHGLEVWNNDGSGNLSLCYENVSPMPETYSHGFDIGLLNGDVYYDAFMGEFGSDGDKVFFGDPSVGLPNREPFTFQLSPNPAGNWLDLGIEGNSRALQMEIFDARACLLMATNLIGSDNYSLNISGLGTGLYLLVLTDEWGQRFTSRFIKD